MFGFGKKKPLAGIRVAVLATDGVEQIELTSPWAALHKAGAELFLISLRRGKIQAMNALVPGKRIPVDATLNDVHPSSFAALLLPGGFVNPDLLRQSSKAVDFVRSFIRSDRPIAAICHGPWLLASAGALRGRTITSWPGIQDDMRNAGAIWQDEPVVIDGNILTSRGPHDIKKFNKHTIKHFTELVNAYA
jgi:protease I